MISRLKTVLNGLLAMTIVAAFAPTAIAQCGGFTAAKVKRTNWSVRSPQGRLLRAAYAMAPDEDEGQDNNSIVGMWHVKFVIPVPGNPIEIDAGYSVWHKDGTEIMNSGLRPPATGDFCLGVWKKTKDRNYHLNHFAASWNDAGTALLGPANIREDVTLSDDGQSFSGTFSIVQYDEAGNIVKQAQGHITGTRITVDTGFSPIE